MKKIFTLAALAVMMMSAPVMSQARDGFFNFGIKAGLNFTNMSGLKDFNQPDFLKTYTGFNAGMVLLNPEILYVQSGQRTKGYEFNIPGADVIQVNGGSFRTGSIRVPINVQWGIGLFNDFIKPYVVVSPYVGAVLFGKGSILNVDFDSESVNSYLNRFQYGIGVGAGIYIWNFQVSFKWNWDLNPAFKDNGSFTEAVGDAVKADNKKFSGGELSLAFFF